VDWIGIRPERKQPLVSVRNVHIALTGLEGDHRNTAGKRAVTLIQSEHLDVIRTLSSCADVNFADLRRNIAVCSINLLALRNKTISVGGAVLHITGPCAPCSRMERLMGTGGYNAMRGHGGVTAEVLHVGDVSLGDAIRYEAD
jgi:MOSC domain-containing protein YiiM